MRSDLDEQDLYPPDAEDHELTAEAKNHRTRAAVGATLLTWGMSLIVQIALGVDIDTFVLGLGIGALAGWSQLRRYNWFVVGAVAAGLGAAEVAGAVVGGAFGAAVSSLLVAAGFAAIYVRYPRRSMWALVPAAIMALIAAGAFGVGLIGLLPAVLGKFLLPLLLVGGGALLLFRHSLPPKTVKVALAALAVTFVLVGANSVPDIDREPSFGPRRFGPSPPSIAQPLPLVAGGTLVMINDGSGDIEFRVGEPGMPAQIAATGGDGPDVIHAQPDPSGRVVVGTDRMFGSDKGVDYVVTLPPGVDIDVERGSGSIKGSLRSVTGTIRTTSGDVELALQKSSLEGDFTDGTLDIETKSGSVTVGSDFVLKLDLASEDDVFVNRDNKNGRFRSPPGVAAMELEVDADSGDIKIDMPQQPASADELPSTTVAPSSPSPTPTSS